MAQIKDDSRDLRIDEDSVGGGYFKHAVYNHWDPYGDIPQEKIEKDREKLIESDLSESDFYEMQMYLALFGAGEEAVTEDLAPMMIALEDINDQMFISSQIYEEGKHTQFFDRYWKEVIHPVAEERGWEKHNPTEQHFFNDAYVDLFHRNEEAMERLLTEDTPTNRVEAYCHYHLTVESILAQTGYWGFTSVFSPKGSDQVVPDQEMPHLKGLIDGFSYIRSDEGRHVGFGMRKVQHHIDEDGVDKQVVQDTLQDLIPLVANIVSAGDDLVNPVPLVDYARGKLTRRLDIITDAEATVPDVDDLVALDDDAATAD